MVMSAPTRSSRSLTTGPVIAVAMLPPGEHPEQNEGAHEPDRERDDEQQPWVAHRLRPWRLVCISSPA